MSSKSCQYLSFKFQLTSVNGPSSRAYLVVSSTIIFSLGSETTSSIAIILLLKRSHTCDMRFRSQYIYIWSIGVQSIVIHISLKSCGSVFMANDIHGRAASACQPHIWSL